MDEVSPIGTLTVDDDGCICPACLGYSKEFLDYFEKQTKVDWVISAVIIPEESSGWWRYEPYFFSRNDIADCRGRIVDYATFQFLESNPNISETVFNIARLKHHGCGVNSEVSKE